MEEKVLQNLITLYRNRGVSVEKVFQNPLFGQLPVEKKIQIIKTLGEKAKANNGIRWDRDDVKKLLLGLGLGALAIAVGKSSFTTLRAYQQHAASLGQKFDTLAHLAPQALTLAGAGITAGAELKGFADNYSTKKDFYHLDTSNDNAIINYLARI